MTGRNKIKEPLPRRVFLFFNYILMILILLATLFPLLKVLSDSFEAAPTYGFKLWPKEFTLAAYTQIIQRPDLMRPFLISLLTTTVGTLVSMILTTLAGYVLIQEDMPGKKAISLMIMFTMVFNAGLIPNFMVIRNLKLFDTIWAVILPSALSTYNIILMRNFFETVPPSLSESANLDGCSPFQIFYKIMLPLSKPALATISLFTIVSYWNEFFSFVIYTNKVTLQNFQVLLRKIIILGDTVGSMDLYVFPDTLRNAAIVVSIIPVMCIYPFLQQYFVQGINLGAVKD